MSQKTTIKSDHISLYVTAGGYIARPFFGTCFKEGDEVITHHFGGSIHAGVGLPGISGASFRNKNTFEYWTTTGAGLWERSCPKYWKVEGKKFKRWEDYITASTTWYYLHASPAKKFAEPLNRKYARSKKRKFRDYRELISSNFKEG